MTPEEKVDRSEWGKRLTAAAKSDLKRWLRAAVAEERERCARVAEVEAQHNEASARKAKRAGRDDVSLCRESNAECATRIAAAIRCADG